jgi:anti-sigma factor RsiW
MTSVTREIIIDLWPVYASGEASEDTRALVDAFLAGDPELARSLKEGGDNPLASCAVPSLPPDHQLKTLDRLRRRLRGPIWLLQFAIMFSCFAFGRIVSDTSWDVSPRNFIVTSLIAAAFWVAFLLVLFRGRRSVLIRLK